MRLWISSLLLAFVTTGAALPLVGCKKDTPPAAAPAPVAAPTEKPADPAAPTDKPAAPAAADKPAEPAADPAAAEKPAAPTGDAPAELAGAADKPAAIPADVDASIEKGVALYEEMSTLFSTHKADCDKLATQLSAFADKNAETLASFQKTMMTLDPSLQEATRVKYEARMEKAGLGFMEGAQNCQANPGVTKAMAKMMGAPDMGEMGDMPSTEPETAVIKALVEVSKKAGEDCDKLDTELGGFLKAETDNFKAFVTRTQAADNPEMTGDFMALIQVVSQLQQCEAEGRKNIAAMREIFVQGAGAEE